jgi:hypothetical protein
MTAGPEKKTKDAIRALLKEIGAWYYMPVPVGYGTTALDFYVCYKGRFYGIEAKRADGKGVVSAMQKSIMNEIVAHEGACCVEDTLDCRNVKKMLGL